MLGRTSINMGMQTTVHDIPHYLITMVEALRAKLRDQDFLARHRVRPQDFTRQRQLTFPRLMLFLLQQTVKSIQRHRHEFLDELAQGQCFEPVTSGAVTHARAKLKESAFSELNRDCVLSALYHSEHPVRRWRGHRLVGFDSSLVRLPESDELGQLQPGCIEINDRGFTGYLYLARVGLRQAHFIARSSTGSFLVAQELFRLNRANQSKVVWLFAPADQKAECQRLGLPLKMLVRFVSLRLPTGELEVLATSLLEEERYPTAEFLTVYHWRWGHETFYLMLKGRLELENFSGRTAEAVRQDVQAAVLLANLESVLSEPAQAALNGLSTTATQTRQVNRSNSYHALKDQVLDLLYRDIPAPTVINKLMRLFKGSPVALRPNRNVPRRRKPSFHRSYHFQRRVKKTVF